MKAFCKNTLAMFVFTLMALIGCTTVIYAMCSFVAWELLPLGWSGTLKLLRVWVVFSLCIGIWFAIDQATEATDEADT